MMLLAIPHLEEAAADGRDAAARGDWSAADIAFRRALATAEASGDTAHVAVALTNAGQAALHAGSLDEAEALLARAVAVRESLVSAGEARASVVARALGDLAMARHARGDADDAVALLARAARAADDGDATLADAYRRALDALSPGSATARSPERLALAVPALDAPALDDLVAIDLDLPPDASPTTGLPMLAMTGEHDAIPADTESATSGLPMLDYGDEPSVAAPAVAPASGTLEPLDLDVDDLTPPPAAPPRAEPTRAFAEPDAEGAIESLALDDLMPGAGASAPIAPDAPTSIPALRVDVGFDEELDLAPVGEAAPAIPALDIETHDLSVDTSAALADAPSIELEALVPGAAGPDDALGPADSLPSLSTDDVPTPAGAAPSPLAALDLDTLELAGPEAEPEAVQREVPPSAPASEDASELDELAFLRGPLHDAGRPRDAAQAPIEQVLAELDAELGTTHAGAADLATGTPISAASVPSDDGKPSLWQRLRGKGRR